MIGVAQICCVLNWFEYIARRTAVKGILLDPGLDELDVAHAKETGVAAGLLDHLQAQIDANDLAGRPHPASGENVKWQQGG